MAEKYTEEQIQEVLEKIRKKDPKGATRERAIKILGMVETLGVSDIMSALNKVSKAKKKPEHN